jgi:hypothetical protein
MLSLNGIRPFRGKHNTKTVRVWPKADNIISFRVEMLQELSYTRLRVGSSRVCSVDLEALLVWREV